MQTLLKNTRAYGLMKNERGSGTLAHAYLLVFEDERNLRTAMKTFAKLLFGCDGEKTEKEKRISSLIDGEIFSDCLFLPKDGEKFVVTDAANVIEESALRPVEGETKVFVIADLATATPAAQNKLLKILEEPPEGVKFLLGTTSVFPVLPTVLSRVKTLDIHPFSVKETQECLARTYKEKYTQSEYELCAAASGGYVGRAESMLEGGAYKNLVEEAFALAAATEKELPLLVKKTGETKRKKELLSLLRILWRDALLYKLFSEKKDGNALDGVLLRSEEERSKALAKKRTLSALVFAQEAVSKAEKDVTFNAYFPQCLEILLASVLRENQRN